MAYFGSTGAGMMKKLLPIGALILTFSLGANAQQAASVERNPPVAGAHQYSIRAGTFMVELTKPLHAAKVQVGEEVIAIPGKRFAPQRKGVGPEGIHRDRPCD